MFDFVFVVFCVIGLLGMLARAAAHENDGRQAPQPLRVRIGARQGRGGSQA